MTPAQIIRAAIPAADEGLVDHIMWARTPFPCGRVTAQSIYRAASRWRRAGERGVELCEMCDRLAASGSYTCAVCTAALSRHREAT